jgi:hypothetical protein
MGIAENAMTDPVVAEIIGTDPGGSTGTIRRAQRLRWAVRNTVTPVPDATGTDSDDTEDVTSSV